MEFDAKASTWRHSQATLIQKCNVTTDRLIEARFDNCDGIFHSESICRVEAMNTDNQADNLAQKSTTESSSDNCNDTDAPLPTMISLITGSLIDNCPHSDLYNGMVSPEDKFS